MVDFDIDFWPGIPPFLEMDAPDLDILEKYIIKIGLHPQNAKNMSTKQIYEHYKIDIVDMALNETVDIKVDDSLERFMKLFGTGIGRVCNP